MRQALQALVLAAPILLAPILPGPAAWIAGVAWAESRPDEILADPVLEERAREVGRELRCMVCQNQSIEDSDADLAHQLRKLVREQITAGRSNDEVVRFMHDRYGDFVLLRPPFNAATLLLWATPALALLGGLVAVVLMRRRPAESLPPLTEAERERLARLDDPAGNAGGALR
ncbi:cytochrome c-type biogenesis protein [Roseomonas elaeocarpi]|uniref:Cytochrome c-type biogenesis protein n=1 Tax=Roseomonas elaeocarpi TaxID=907779 RepID=A0ABV6JQF6_9PROT